jgi:hypothetical protein
MILKTDSRCFCIYSFQELAFAMEVHVYVLGPTYFVWPWVPHRTFRDVTPGLLSATDTYIVYHVTHFEAFRNVILHTRYVITYVGAGCGRGRETKKTNPIRCGACYYSIVLNAQRVTSMADTDIDAVRKQKKTYTWSGTSIIKDGRYTFTFYLWSRIGIFVLQRNFTLFSKS